LRKDHASNAFAILGAATEALWEREAARRRAHPDSVP